MIHFFKVLRNKLKSLKYEFKSLEGLDQVVMEKDGIIILMYHSIPSAESIYRYSTPQEAFEGHMRYLADKCHVISIKQAFDILSGNKVLVSDKPTFVITFDDGYLNNYNVAYPILSKYNLKFTIFLTTGFIDKDNHTFMSWNHVKEMSNDSLVTFGAHSQSHANLCSLEDKDKAMEIVNSRREIESKINKRVDYFAYPSGGFDDFSLSLVDQNYLAGFKDRTDGNWDEDSKKIGRISIDGRHNSLRSFLIQIACSRSLGA